MALLLLGGLAPLSNKPVVAAFGHGYPFGMRGVFGAYGGIWGHPAAAGHAIADAPAACAAPLLAIDVFCGWGSVAAFFFPQLPHGLGHRRRPVRRNHVRRSLLRFGAAHLDGCWVLALALLPALVEELFFRGALLSGLEKWGQGAAILVSSLCFALVHGSAANFLGPLVAGLLFGYLTVITGSLWPAVVGHLCNNLVYLWMGYVLKRYAAFGIWPLIFC